MTIILAAIGGVLVGLFVGLWWGERGRRIDAQRAKGMYRPPITPKATVTEEAELASAPIEPIFSPDQIEQMIQDVMAETGCSRRDAEDEVTSNLQAGAIMGLTP